MKINLLVIRSAHPEALKKQYELLGLNFKYHQHGNGPFHYSTEIEDFIFEIYPLLKPIDKANDGIRLGFEVENLSFTLKQLAGSNWEILSNIQETDWGNIAIIQDLDGRKVELKNT